MRNVSRLIVMSICILAIGLSAAESPCEMQDDGRVQYVIFVLLDAARADHLSCYGYGKRTTPRIDAIADAGALFQNNFAQGTETATSLSSIFSSRYFSLPLIERNGGRWGIKEESPKYIFKELDPQHMFLPSVLSASGYRTVLFSDHVFFGGTGYLESRFDETYQLPLETNGYLTKTPRDNAMIAKMIPWIRENMDKRFFIYWHIVAPHVPYRVVNKDSEFLAGKDEETIRSVSMAVSDPYSSVLRSLDKDGLDCLAGLYDNNLKYADMLVGILYEGLKEFGILDKTLLIITADHGESLMEHGIFGHGVPPWDSLIRVPLIISYPPLIRHKVKIKGLTESVDIMPTILDICDIETPAGKSMDGISLLKYTRHPNEGKEAVFTHDSVRTKKYKYWIGRKALYDIRKDPEEKNNIIDKEPAVAGRLMNTYTKSMKHHAERFEKSVKRRAPDYLFYFSVMCFGISPKDAVVSCTQYQIMPFIEHDASHKPWVLNTFYDLWALFRLPENPSEPISLSAKLPNGKYNIYLMLNSPHELNGAMEGLGLRYRLDEEEPFRYPQNIALFRKIAPNAFYYYLYLGEVLIKDSAFSFQIDFQPKDKSLYSILHVKFVPSGADEDTDQKAAPERDEEFKDKAKRLKSLGYL